MTELNKKDIARLQKLQDFLVDVLQMYGRECFILLKINKDESLKLIASSVNTESLSIVTDTSAFVSAKEREYIG